MNTLIQDSQINNNNENYTTNSNLNISSGTIENEIKELKRRKFEIDNDLEKKMNVFNILDEAYKKQGIKIDLKELRSFKPD